MNISDCLIEQNNNFKKLVERLKKKRKKECNIFKILRVDSYEIRHSNFLTWLLDKNASHNMGAAFLEKFLARAKIDFSLEILNKNIEIETESKIEIVKENNKKRIGRIDILLIGEDFICVIENKYGSFEHDNQCQDYKTFIENKYKSKTNKYFIFLDLSKPADFNSDEGRYCGYNFVSYKDILDILKEILENKNNTEISSIILRQYTEILDAKYNKIDEDIKEFYKNNTEFIEEIKSYDFTDFEEDAKDAIYALMDYHKIKKNYFNCFVKDNFLKNIVNEKYITMKGYDWAYAIDLKNLCPNLYFTELDFPMINNKLNIQLYMGLTKAKLDWYMKTNLKNNEFWKNLTKNGYSICFTTYIKNGAGYPTICNFAVSTSNNSFVEDCNCEKYKNLWGRHEAKCIVNNPKLIDFLKKNFKDNSQIVIKNLNDYQGKQVYVYPAVCVNYEFSEDISKITTNNVKNKINEILCLFGEKQYL